MLPRRATWVDVHTVIPADGHATDTGTGTSDANEQGLPLFALNKYSKEANGDDFTVVSLNDNGVGGSEIYLGKKDELYTTDLLHPVTA
jgi:hypothetical protein